MFIHKEKIDILLVTENHFTNKNYFSIDINATPLYIPMVQLMQEPPYSLKNHFNTTRWRNMKKAIYKRLQLKSQTKIIHKLQ